MLSKVIAQANIDHAEKWFERADKIVIVTHVSPSGDTWVVLSMAKQER